MKVVMVVPYFPKLSETFIVSKFVGLLDQGIDVHIFCNGSNHSEWNNFSVLLNHSELRKRIHINWPTTPRIAAAVLFLPALLSSFFIKPLATFRFLKIGLKDHVIKVFKEFYLDRELILLKPDILHYEFGALAVEKEYIKKRINCKLVASFRGHDIYFVGLESRNYYMELWTKVDAVHFLGTALYKKAVSRGFKASIPYALIPPAIDPKKFAPSEKQVDTSKREFIKILSIGRLHWAKGYEYALQALCNLYDRGYRFEYHIVGGGDEFDCLTFCCHQQKINENVTFLGSVPPEQVYEELKWADIFLHPAVEEGFGNVVIEAQAMQLPVICSDAVGLPENVENGVTGFVVPRRNPQELAEKLILLAQDPNLRLKMGEEGRKRVIEKFQNSDQIRAFYNLYQEVMKKE